MGFESAAAPPAFLVVKSPSGGESRLTLERLPFRIGRQADNELILRDSRASRRHAQILAENGQYVLEDLKSAYGVFVNGQKVDRVKLRTSDRIEFGFPDSYRVVFTMGLAPAASQKPLPPEIAGGSSLSKLRAMLEVARALQSSLSTDDVLATVVDAALTVTGCERGFLLLRNADDLEIRMARSGGGPLPAEDLRVPTRLLLRALNMRKEFLSMNFDPEAGGPEHTVADLELRSVVCVPLVRVRTGTGRETVDFDPADDTVGLLYMDSRLRSADLSSGGRELLTTLAIEASTVLENARLLEQEWERQRMRQELRIAREIQESLLPRQLPATGWFRATASSAPSEQVGGDYLDIRQMHQFCWSAISADISGKGVGAALLASLLQGMFLAAPFTCLSMEEMMFRVNRFLNERTGGERYATLFFCSVESSGAVCWVNAGHPPPLIVRVSGALECLGATGVPLGMLEESAYPIEHALLRPGDKIVIYSDGLTEARNTAGEFFGPKRLRETALALASASCTEMHTAILGTLDAFTQAAPQYDDISLAVVEYHEE